MESKCEIDECGTKRWHNSECQLHREDGPAIERVSGTKEWFRNGLFHREDGPAFEGSDGTKEWHRNDKLHREDGPAIEWSDGYKEWWIDGAKLTEEEFLKRTKKEEPKKEQEEENMSLKITKNVKMKDSSFIRSSHYNIDKKELTVQFKDNSVYMYFDVPEIVVKKWIGAKSVGQYFHKHIRGLQNIKAT
jgi:hypothetical protein